jgi:hypothetical protein
MTLRTLFLMAGVAIAANEVALGCRHHRPSQTEAAIFFPVALPVGSSHARRCGPRRDRTTALAFVRPVFAPSLRILSSRRAILCIPEWRRARAALE